MRPHFAFYCPLFLRKKEEEKNPANHNAELHFMPRNFRAVFALDVATALRQINREMATR